MDRIRDGVARDRARLCAFGNRLPQQCFRHRRTCAAHDERDRPLAPTGIWNTDNGRLCHAGDVHQERFQFKRRDPFAARLDDVLQPIDDPNRAVGIDLGNVAGMKASAVPQRIGSVLLPVARSRRVLGEH